MANRSPQTGTSDATPNSTHTKPLALRPKDAAKALGLGERKLWELTKAGKIPSVRVGTCILYPVELLEKWLRDQVETGRCP